MSDTEKKLVDVIENQNNVLAYMLELLMQSNANTYAYLTCKNTLIQSKEMIDKLKSEH